LQEDDMEWQWCRVLVRLMWWIHRFRGRAASPKSWLCSIYRRSWTNFSWHHW
jgi:hypothetical protein